MLEIKLSHSQKRNLEDGYWKWFKTYQLDTLQEKVESFFSLQRVIFGSHKDYNSWKKSTLKGNKPSSLKDSDLSKYREYILCKPENLEKLHNNSKAYVSGIKKRNLQYYFEDTYKRIRNSVTIGKLYQSELDLKSCPYCNRSFLASTYKRNKKLYLTYELDHFYCKHKNPFLAFVLYNLVPCCHTCNHIKSDSSNNIMYPFLNSFKDKSRFEYVDIRIVEKIINASILKKDNLVTLKSYDKIVENSINEFYLRELYAFHENEAEELIYKKHIFSEGQVEEFIQDYFNKLGFDKEKIHNILYSSYLTYDSHHKKVLSKYFSDLYLDLLSKGI